MLRRETSVHQPAHPRTYLIALGPWPIMVAHLLLSIVGDAESRISDDLARARVVL